MRDLLTRTTEEIGPDGTIEGILEDPESHSAYVGFEPSGDLHIGHLVVAQKMIDLQKLGIDVTILLADLHATLNGKGELDEVQYMGDQMVEAFMEFGLDKDKTNFVFGTDFQDNLEYQMDVQDLSQNVTLSRARRAMSDIGSDQEKVSNILYPVMQAVDIDYLDVDIAVGGMEQRKVHMLARDTLPSIGADKPMYIHTPLIEDLGGDDSKMSTSTGVSISTSDSPEDIREAVDSAFCPPATEQEGKENPIVQIAEFLVFPRLGSVEVSRPEEYGGDVPFDDIVDLKESVDSGELHPNDLKSGVADALVEILCGNEESEHSDAFLDE